MKKTKGFGLAAIIIIIIVTALISCIATGVIMLNSSANIKENNTNNVIEDKELLEFIEVYETLVSKYYADIDKKGMLDAAEEGMLDFLGDKYTTFLEDSEYNDILNELSATYNGIGITIENNKIINVTESSPAEKAGLQKDDLIIKVNDTDVTTSSGNTIGNMIRNAEKKITLLINRNNEVITFDIEKTDLVNVAIDYKVIENTKIGYIQIKKFSENLDKQVSKALKKLEEEHISSLIIDVRDNVGGYLSAAEETASLFLKNGKVIYSLETNNTTMKYKDDTKESRDYKIVVLINSGSASASEILAAALKDSYGATLVGIKSYGKGKVQQIIGSSAKYTFAKWLTPDGECIDGIGITPDYVVANNLYDPTDYQIEKAIELLSN